MFKQVLGMMPRKSAFNFAKRKKQLSIPQHSATFLFVISLVITSGASAAESTVRRAIGTTAVVGTIHPKGYPLGKMMFFLRPHSIFSIKKTAWGS